MALLEGIKQVDPITVSKMTAVTDANTGGSPSQTISSAVVKGATQPTGMIAETDAGTGGLATDEQILARARVTPPTDNLIDNTPVASATVAGQNAIPTANARVGVVQPEPWGTGYSRNTSNPMADNRQSPEPPAPGEEPPNLFNQRLQMNQETDAGTRPIAQPDAQQQETKQPDAQQQETKQPDETRKIPTGTIVDGTTDGKVSDEDVAQQTAMDIIADIQSDVFQYDPGADESYRQAASVIENQVAQMMVGRGGLYSSITNSAIQSRLMTLQIDFRKAAYEEFVNERNFKLQLASFVASREDEAFNRQMTMAKFNLDVQAQQFSQQMQRSNLALSQARFSYEKEQNNLALQQNALGSIIESQVNGYNAQYGTYQEMVNAWKAKFRAPADVAAYFGVNAGTPYNPTAIAKKASALQSVANSIDSLRVQYAQVGGTLNDLNEVYNQSTVNVASSPINQLGTTTQQRAWAATRDNIWNAIELGDSSKARIIADFKAQANTYIYGTLTKDGMGTLLYQKLLAELEG